MDEQLRTLPLWKAVCEEMLAAVAFKARWDFTWLETQLECKRETNEFKFAMMAIRSEIELQTGYYIEQDSSESCYQVRDEHGHEAKCEALDAMPRRSLIRSINIRTALLQNPTAQIADQDRKRIEKRLEIAATRLVLMSRAVSISQLVQKHKPNLLDKPKSK
jgi:hypothetical protein